MPSIALSLFTLGRRNSDGGIFAQCWVRHSLGGKDEPSRWHSTSWCPWSWTHAVCQFYQWGLSIEEVSHVTLPWTEQHKTNTSSITDYLGHGVVENAFGILAAWWRLSQEDQATTRHCEQSHASYLCASQLSTDNIRWEISRNPSSKWQHRLTTVSWFGGHQKYRKPWCGKCQRCSRFIQGVLQLGCWCSTLAAQHCLS